MDCKHASPPCPSPIPRACSNSCPLSRWCHPTISSSVVPFSSHLQSSPASRSFPRTQFFSSCGQSIGASASTSVLPLNNQDWFPLGLTGLTSLQSRGLLKVFSNTTVQKHQFFSAQLSLWSSYHISTWLLDRNLKYTKSALKINSKITNYWKFPGGLVIKILCFHSKGPDSNPGQRTKILCCTAKIDK